MIVYLLLIVCMPFDSKYFFIFNIISAQFLFLRLLKTHAAIPIIKTSRIPPKSISVPEKEVPEELPLWLPIPLS